MLNNIRKINFFIILAFILFFYICCAYDVTKVNAIELKYNVTISNGVGGQISGVFEQEYDENENLIITVTADTGYYIKSIFWGNISIKVTDNKEMTFLEMVKEDTNLTVEYEKIVPVTPNTSDTPSSDNAQNTTGENNGSGCSSSLNVSYIGVITTLIATLALVIIKLHKKEN